MFQPADSDLPRLPTLVLTALMVAALAGWLAWRLWRNWSSAVRLATAATALVDRIAEARATAVATGETITLNEPRPGERLPNGVCWDVPAGNERIDFRPDGTTTAESVHLRIGDRQLIIPLRSNAATRD